MSVNLVMIFVGMQFIDLAFQTQFSNAKPDKAFTILTAMYLAFIAGLFPNYATTLAEELRQVDRRSIKEIFEVILFFLIVLALNAGVIFLALKI